MLEKFHAPRAKLQLAHSFPRMPTIVAAAAAATRIHSLPSPIASLRLSKSIGRLYLSELLSLLSIELSQPLPLLFIQWYVAVTAPIVTTIAALEMLLLHRQSRERMIRSSFVSNHLDTIRPMEPSGCIVHRPWSAASRGIHIVFAKILFGVVFLRKFYEKKESCLVIFVTVILNH
jgi:hypothetical protein